MTLKCINSFALNRVKDKTPTTHIIAREYPEYHLKISDSTYNEKEVKNCLSGMLKSLAILGKIQLEAKVFDPQKFPLLEVLPFFKGPFISDNDRIHSPLEYEIQMYVHVSRQAAISKSWPVDVLFSIILCRGRQ